MYSEAKEWVTYWDYEIDGLDFFGLIIVCVTEKNHGNNKSNPTKLYAIFVSRYKSKNIDEPTVFEKTVICTLDGRGIEGFP